jgi:xanthine phosphoribosyltransferase
MVVAGFLVEKLFQGGRTGLEERAIPTVTLAQVRLLREGRVIMSDAQA